MAISDVTKKAGIYHTLYEINEAFAAIVGHYQALRKMGALGARITRRYEGFTRELQAEFNQDFLLPLHSIELDDWARFGKVRQQWEKHLRDPHDAALESGEHKRKHKRAKGKKMKANKSFPKSNE